MDKPRPDPDVIATMAEDLAVELSDEQLQRGLSRLRKEREWVSVKAIIELSGASSDDGRPGVETAWAMCPKTEEASAVWTTEMAQAFQLCRPLLVEGNEIAARMVFKEQYSEIMARANHEPVRWDVSLGWEPNGRLAALQDAIEKKRITEGHALSLLGWTQREELLAQLPPATRKQLVGETAPRNTAFLNDFQKTLHTMREEKVISAPEPEPEPQPSILDDPEKKRARIEMLKAQAASRKPVESETA